MIQMEPILEVAFKTLPSSSTPIWDDITPWLKRWDFTRSGRESDLEEFEAGELTAILDNTRGYFLPEYSGESIKIGEIGVAVGGGFEFMSTTDINAAVAKIAASGAKTLRADCKWGQVENTQGARNWEGTGGQAKYDSVEAACRANNLHLIFTAGYSGTWVTGAGSDDKVAPTTPTEIAAFGKFCGDIAARYGPLATDSGGLKAIEIWNEPNLGNTFYKPAADPAGYTTGILASAYAQVKAVNRKILVLFGGIASSSHYEVGDYVKNGGNLYQCTVDYPTSTPPGAGWTQKTPFYGTWNTGPTNYVTGGYVEYNGIIYVLIANDNATRSGAATPNVTPSKYAVVWGAVNWDVNYAKGREPVRFLDQALSAGAGNLCDGIAIHPYAYDWGGLGGVGTAANLTQIFEGWKYQHNSGSWFGATNSFETHLRDQGYGHLKLWVTETGIDGQSEANQAAAIDEVLNRLRTYDVATIDWYTFYVASDGRSMVGAPPTFTSNTIYTAFDTYNGAGSAEFTLGSGGNPFWPNVKPHRRLRMRYRIGSSTDETIRNRLHNGGFEVGDQSGWTKQGTRLASITISASPSEASSGLQRARVDSASLSNATAYLLSDRFTINPKQQRLSVTARFRSYQTGQNQAAKVQVKYYDVEDNFLSTAYPTVDLTGATSAQAAFNVTSSSYATYGGLFALPPANAFYARVFITLLDSPPAGTNVGTMVDDIQAVAHSVNALPTTALAYTETVVHDVWCGKDGGYIDAWPTVWPDRLFQGECAVQATDAFKVFGMNHFQSWPPYQDMVSFDKPDLFYPLQDIDTQNVQNVGTIQKEGTFTDADHVALDQPPIVPGEVDGSSVMFNFDGGGVPTLHTGLFYAGKFTVEVVIKTTDVDAITAGGVMPLWQGWHNTTISLPTMQLAYLGTGALRLIIRTPGPTTHTTTTAPGLLADNTTYHIEAEWGGNGTTPKIRLNGVLVATGSTISANMLTGNSSLIAYSWNVGEVTGLDAGENPFFAYAAMWQRVLETSRIEAHADALFKGRPAEVFGDRIDHLLSLVPGAFSDSNIFTGVRDIEGYREAGQTYLSEIHAAGKAEVGLFFIDRHGFPTAYGNDWRLSVTEAGVNQCTFADGASWVSSSAIVNQISRLLIEDNGSIGGTFTLTFLGQTTGTIAYNASTATVLAALEALSNIVPGEITVTNNGTTAPETMDYLIEFTGQYAGFPQTLTLNTGGLTGAFTASMQNSYQVGGIGTGPVHYDDLDLSYDDSVLYNIVEGSRESPRGTLQRSTDTLSIAEYDERVLPLGQLKTVDDADTLATTEDYLARYKDPLNRVKALRVYPDADTTGIMRTRACTLEVGHQVTVKRRPLGLPGGIVQTSQIESISHSGNVETGEWSVEYGISPR